MISRCNIISSNRNNGEGGCSPTYKLALLNKVEIRESFSKEITRDILKKTK